MNTNDLFPIYGITLGKTKISEIAQSADCQIKVSDGEAIVVNGNAVFVQQNGYNTVTIASFHGNIPQKIERGLGVYCGMSTDDCIKLLRQKGIATLMIAGRDPINKIAFFDCNSALAYVLSFDSVMGLDGIRIVYSKCPKCSSDDVEAIDILNSSCICNSCGHRWESGDLYLELEEQFQGVCF